MAKRFIDTDLWERNWFLRLSPEERQAFIFIFCKCDCIGIYRYSMMHNIILGDIDIEDLAIKLSDHIEILDTEKLWLKDFIDFQYGTLSEDCRPHKKYIEELEKAGLLQRVLASSTKGIRKISKGINTLQEKEKEKEKEKDKEEEKEQEEDCTDPSPGSTGKAAGALAKMIQKRFGVKRVNIGKCQNAVAKLVKEKGVDPGYALKMFEWVASDSSIEIFGITDNPECVVRNWAQFVNARNKFKREQAKPGEPWSPILREGPQ